MPIISPTTTDTSVRQRTGSLTAANTADNATAPGAMQWVRARYSFATQGGAVGTIALVGAAVIPANAVIIDSGIDVVTVPTSAGAATLGVDTEAAGDIVTAAVISGAPWSTTGRKNGTPQDAATSVKTTVARDISVRVGVAALTAGVFDVYVGFIVTA